MLFILALQLKFVYSICLWHQVVQEVMLASAGAMRKIQKHLNQYEEAKYMKNLVDTDKFQEFEIHLQK